MDVQGIIRFARRQTDGPAYAVNPSRSTVDKNNGPGQSPTSRSLKVKLEMEDKMVE